MNRSARFANTATLAILVVACFLVVYMWRTGSGEPADDSIGSAERTPDAPPPREAEHPRPAPLRNSVPVGSFWMKCEAALGHGSATGSRFDSDPCGWKEITVDGTGRWYRMFVQTVVVPDATVDGGYGYGETRITFTARGRHAAVPCGGKIRHGPPAAR